MTNGPDFWQFYTSFGGELQDPETGRLIFDKAAMEKTFQFFADAVEMGVTRRNHLARHGTNGMPKLLLVKRRSGMVVLGITLAIQKRKAG